MTAGSRDRSAVMNIPSLDALAAQVNQHFEILGHTGPAYDEQRISVGLLLIEARDSVQRGKWYDWVKANIKRSIRDCQKAIAVAHAPDPHRKLAEQRKKNRQYARRHRQSLTDAPRTLSTCCGRHPRPVLQQSLRTPSVLARISTEAALHGASE